MLDIQKFIWTPRIITSDESNVTTFQLNYLPRGFGHTLWNAMRRIILSYTLWWAITWLKIKGVPHEYDVIEGVKENVINIMLNFKILRFKFDESLDYICVLLYPQEKYSQYLEEIKTSETPAWISLKRYNQGGYSSLQKSIDRREDRN